MALSMKIMHLFRVLIALFISLPARIRYPRALTADIRQVWENRIQFKIRKGARVNIGKNLHVRRNVSIRCESGTIEIGENVFMNNNVSITALKKITIMSGAAIANNVVIVDHDHDYRAGVGFVCDEVRIGKNVWIGANTTILRGTNIGDGSVIAAGSVIKGEIPADSIVIQERPQHIRSIER